jgi:hypothetical protein
MGNLLISLEFLSFKFLKNKKKIDLNKEKINYNLKRILKVFQNFFYNNWYNIKSKKENKEICLFLVHE